MTLYAEFALCQVSDCAQFVSRRMLSGIGLSQPLATNSLVLMSNALHSLIAGSFAFIDEFQFEFRSSDCDDSKMTIDGDKISVL